MIPRALIHETHSRTHSDIHFSLPHWHIFAHFSIVSGREKEREKENNDNNISSYNKHMTQQVNKNMNEYLSE